MKITDIRLDPRHHAPLFIDSPPFRRLLNKGLLLRFPVSASYYATILLGVLGRKHSEGWPSNKLSMDKSTSQR